MSEKESCVVEVGGERFDVSEQMKSALDSIVAMGQPIETAWAMVQTMVANGLIKKSEAPKEVVPDLAELAKPFVDKALADGGTLVPYVESYLEAKANLEASLESAGLDTDLEVSGGEAAGFITLEREWPESQDVLRMIVKIKRDSDLGKIAARVPDTLRLATAAVYSIVAQVGKNNGIDPEKIKVAVSIGPDGSVSLTGKRASSGKRGGGGGGGGGTRSSYEYSFENGTHLITKNGNAWVASDASTEKELLSAIKVAMVADGLTFAACHWRGSDAVKGKDWWPFK